MLQNKHQNLFLKRKNFSPTKNNFYFIKKKEKKFTMLLTVT